MVDVVCWDSLSTHGLAIVVLCNKSVDNYFKINKCQPVLRFIFLNLMTDFKGGLGRPFIKLFPVNESFQNLMGTFLGQIL